MAQLLTVEMIFRFSLILILFYFIESNVGDEYIFDDSVGLGRVFDGVGAISGGGVGIS